MMIKQQIYQKNLVVPDTLLFGTLVENIFQCVANVLCNTVNDRYIGNEKRS